MEKIIQINETYTTVDMEQDIHMSVISKDTLEGMIRVAEEELGHKIMYYLYEVTDDYFNVSVVLYLDSLEISVEEVFPNIDQIYESPFAEDKFIVLWLNNK